MTERRVGTGGGTEEGEKRTRREPGRLLIPAVQIKRPSALSCLRKEHFKTAQRRPFTHNNANALNTKGYTTPLNADITGGYNSALESKRIK